MFYNEVEDGIIMRIRLTPNSSSLSVKDIFVDANGDEYLKIGVVSAPEKGKANLELIKFLSKKLSIPKCSIEIISGEISHYKKVLLIGNKQDILTEIVKLGGGS